MACAMLKLIPPSWGGPLTEADYSNLADSWITREIADEAMLRRVDTHEGRQIVGQRRKADCAGILYSYYWPGEVTPVSYRLRRDHPELVEKNGELKQQGKYLGAPGSGNRLYIPVGITLDHLADVKVPIAIVEGEKKALALLRLAKHASNELRFIPVAIPGVWNWRGTVGKTGGPNGERLDVKGPIADLSRLAWDGRTVFIIFDSNVHTNESVKWARKGITRELATRVAQVKLVNLPEDCGVNGIDDLLAAWGPERVLELIDGAIDGGRLHVVASPQFKADETGIYRITETGGQLQQTQLTNYRASITGSLALDDGVDTRREFEIAAELLERRYTFSVPASEFPKMDWAIEQMGPTAITYPNKREYARTAIQSFSMSAKERRIYTHTGWGNEGKRWMFLHAGGAVGADGAVAGIDVRLAGTLGRYQLRLPERPELVRAVRASLRLASLGSPTIGFPLLAATYRAVFGNADFAIHVVGETGAFKSEGAALFQQHFGAGMDRVHLPGTWSSTGNSLEVLAFLTKDTLLVIDDFAPQGSAADVSRYHAAADRVFRAAGNHAGRSRLDSTAKLREAKPPRALILSTGEDVPRGHSIRARLLILELAKGDIKSDDLTACQEDARAGYYEQSMAGFVQWIAGRYELAQKSFQERIAELRDNALRNPAHARTPEIIANLQAAFEQLLEFAYECGAVSLDEKETLARDCWAALREAAETQAQHHAGTEPTARFIESLRSLLSSGCAHLAARDGGQPDGQLYSCGWRRDGSGNYTPRGECIGWVDGADVYLEPASSYRVIQLACREMGENLAISEQTLRKRLHEKGLLVSTDQTRGTLTIRKNIAGSSKSVLHLWRAFVIPEEPDGEEGR